MRGSSVEQYIATPFELQIIKLKMKHIASLLVTIYNNHYLPIFVRCLF